MKFSTFFGKKMEDKDDEENPITADDMNLNND